MNPDQVRAVRYSTGLSARLFAIKVGLKGACADRTIRKWESGESSPRPKYAEIMRGFE